MLNKIDKEIRCASLASLKNREIKVSPNAKFSQNREILKGVAKYANLKIAKLTCRENFI